MRTYTAESGQAQGNEQEATAKCQEDSNEQERCHRVSQSLGSQNEEEDEIKAYAIIYYIYD